MVLSNQDCQCEDPLRILALVTPMFHKPVNTSNRHSVFRSNSNRFCLSFMILACPWGPQSRLGGEHQLSFFRIFG